ncbi:alpha/beta fold hydrolase [Acutalibacter intestini]|uniref:alpha/beta fold hydrolase n=1 Tax=Acutalibacter intestini TaxID=3093659 RepID=UPI002AC9475C|nr:alpha/beta hydrolase [Acutalibacter sp. M00204]
MDISLHYREEGAGWPSIRESVLILLHGNGQDGGYFRHQMEFFSRRCRVIAVDTRGHGRSPRGTAPFTMEQFAGDLKGLLDEMGIEAPILLGFSDGANIAMKFALQYPGRLRALILNGGNLNTRGIKRRVQLPIELGYRLAKRFASRSEEARRNAEILGLMVHEPNIEPRELGNISVPTLVVAGTRDMVKTAHTREIAAHIPNARLAILPGDHFLASKKPERFNREVERFLDEILKSEGKMIG